MISFECDYGNGAHEEVLRRLTETNNEPALTYGFDRFSQEAKEKIRAACESPQAEVYFLPGGTQTNATAIDGLLRSYEGVITAPSGHINVHEAGAIEAFGHKVIPLPAGDSADDVAQDKLDAATLERFMETFLHDESRDHVAQPGMVYITFPTEFGRIYSAKELSDLYDTCRRYDLRLYIDGARLGYGLASEHCDISLPYLARHCDAFYIGGTKCGALCGEALVFPRGDAPRAFFSIVKRHGALMAKGRLIGVQFDALFTDDLYMRLSRHAIAMAMRLRRLLTDRGYRFFLPSDTNQQFVIIPNQQVHELERRVVFTHWMPFDREHTVCRFVTSWATTEADMEQLESLL